MAAEVPAQATARLAASVAADADRCVKCGLCLPHCPTYGLDGNEAESPRGRISLLQAISREPALAADDDLLTPLDHCLSCRACEAVCPAQVAYGALFDHGQALIARQRPERAARLRRRTLPLRRPRLRRALLRLLWLAQRLGLVALAARLLPQAGLRRAARQLPRLPWPRLPRVADDAGATPSGTVSPEVSLFIGCLGDSIERPAAESLARLLTASGHRVHLPRGQSCCGALQRHGGDDRGAARLLQRNAQAFCEHPEAPILPLASGCAVGLQDAAEDAAAAAGAESSSARAFAQRLRAPWTLLAAAGLRFAPRPERVAVWRACTQRHVLGDDEAMLGLLRSVPQADIVLLRAGSGCCGAAGLHALLEPQRASRLVAELCEAIGRSGASRLLCANVGCRMHLEASLRAAGIRLPVQHPAQWLADSLSRRADDQRG